MIFAKYATAFTYEIPILKRALVDFAVGADWSPAAGDVKVSKDGGAAANIGTLPVAIAMGNTAIWQFVLTGTEMTAARIVITVADSATKAVEDQAIIITTFGNASAHIVFDLGTALSAQTVGTATAVTTVNGLAANTITATSIATDAITAAKIAADAIGAAEIADGAIDANTFAAGAITAAAIAADAIGASELAADAVTEIQSGLATAAALNTVDDFLDTEIADIQSRLPAALVSGRIDASVGAIAANAITATSIAADAITDAKVAADVTIASVTGAVGSVTGNVGGNVTGTVGSVVGAVGSVTGAVGSVTGAVGSVTGNVGGNVTGTVGGLTATAKGHVNAEVVDALATDTYTEVVSAPAANAALSAKIGWVFKQMRNRATQTATTATLYADDGTTADSTSTVSDDATTFVRGEWT